jgi:hypothetical protein
MRFKQPTTPPFCRSSCTVNRITLSVNRPLWYLCFMQCLQLDTDSSLPALKLIPPGIVLDINVLFIFHVSTVLFSGSKTCKPFLLYGLVCSISQSIVYHDTVASGFTSTAQYSPLQQNRTASYAFCYKY